MILCIDPGLNNCGLAICLGGEKLKVLETHNIKNSRKFSDEEKTLEAFYNARVVKITAIVKTVTEFLDKYPDIKEAAIEAPFYHSSTPMAYSSLLEVVSAIRYKVLIPRGIKVHMVEPMLVKKLFIRAKMTRGMTGKDYMKKFLIEHIQSGDILLDKEVDELSEHEIDAIGVGFTSERIHKENL